jgi:hypothetical protein
LSELDEELDDFSVDFGFSAGLSADFSDGELEDGELEDSLVPLVEPLIVLFDVSRLSLR